MFRASLVGLAVFFRLCFALGCFLALFSRQRAVSYSSPPPGGGRTTARSQPLFCLLTLPPGSLTCISPPHTPPRPPTLYPPYYPDLDHSLPSSLCLAPPPSPGFARARSYSLSCFAQAFTWLVSPLVFTGIGPSFPPSTLHAHAAPFILHSFCACLSSAQPVCFGACSQFCPPLLLHFISDCGCPPGPLAVSHAPAVCLPRPPGRIFFSSLF